MTSFRVPSRGPRGPASRLVLSGAGAAALFLLVACLPDEAPEPLDRMALGAVEGVASAVEESLAAEDWAGAAAYFEEGARIFLPGGGTVASRDSIRAFLRRTGDRPPQAVRVTLTDRGGFGSSAWMVGTLSVRWEEGGGWMGLSFFAFLHRGTDGAWWIHRMHLASVSPPDREGDWVVEPDWSGESR